jgi:excisionase family DNA binding protein
MEYITIAEAARRLGTISDKTIRRAVAAGKLEARYPHPNRAEISTEDLEAWYYSLTVRPGETQNKITALETRITQLESEVRELHHQPEASTPTLTPIKKVLPKPEITAPDGFTYLSDFCALHYIPYQAAADLFPRAIHGQKIKVQGRLQPIIGPRGCYDFYVQLHTRADFRTCDNCPHEITERRQHTQASLVPLSN